MLAGKGSGKGVSSLHEFMDQPVSRCSGLAKDKPNVLFLAVDDMNDWIGCLGKTPHAITPNIDKLAKSGVNFSNAHTAGVFCAPSRAAIFSGQFASTTGCYQSANYFVDHPEIESLQTSFAKAGYSTYGAGKLFHHPAGAIDVRDWTHFFLRNPEQREARKNKNSLCVIGLGWEFGGSGAVYKKGMIISLYF